MKYNRIHESTYCFGEYFTINKISFPTSLNKHQIKLNQRIKFISEKREVKSAIEKCVS